jgi:hypothetical protein
VTPRLPVEAAAVIARAKEAISKGNRSGALAMLHLLLTDGPETAAALTPALAQALIATARTELDANDQLARHTFEQTRAARTQVCRLVATAVFDSDDLTVIRSAVDQRAQQLRDEQAQRAADQHTNGTADSIRLGLGWLEQYWVQRRWGPYLRVRWCQNGRKRMKYVGKVVTE